MGQMSEGRLRSSPADVAASALHARASSALRTIFCSRTFRPSGSPTPHLISRTRAIPCGLRWPVTLPRTRRSQPSPHMPAIMARSAQCCTRLASPPAWRIGSPSFERMCWARQCCSTRSSLCFLTGRLPSWSPQIAGTSCAGRPSRRCRAGCAASAGLPRRDRGDPVEPGRCREQLVQLFGSERSSLWLVETRDDPHGRFACGTMGRSRCPHRLDFARTDRYPDGPV